MSKPDVVIVGAGLAGLCCARTLRRHGVSFEILESSDGIGGRVRTDYQDGYLLDRGFQVLLTAYPEALQQLDYDALGMRPFVPGTLIRYHGRFIRLTDPWREPGAFLNNLFAPIGSLSDKYRIWKLRNDLMRRSIGEIFSGEETSTLQALRRRDFSVRMIENFFKPLLGGILLDGKLTASSRMFEFAFKMLSEGDTALPERGMGAIPAQLAEGLPANSIRLETKVKSIANKEVVLESGETLHANSIVVATDGPEACHLLGYSRNVNSRSVSVLYFVAKEPLLMSLFWALPQFPCRYCLTEAHKWLCSEHLQAKSPECASTMTHANAACGARTDSKAVIGATPALLSPELHGNCGRTLFW